MALPGVPKLKRPSAGCRFLFGNESVSAWKPKPGNPELIKCTWSMSEVCQQKFLGNMDAEVKGWQLETCFGHGRLSAPGSCTAKSSPRNWKNYWREKI